jgi:CheY-like chemotaxis protein
VAPGVIIPAADVETAAADGSEGDREEALAIGCCVYLAKPCTPSHLLREIHQHTRIGAS